MRQNSQFTFYDFTRQDQEDEDRELMRELISNLKSVNALLTGLLVQMQ